MNKIVKYLSWILLVIVLLLLMATISNIGNREQEIQSTLSSAVEDTVNTMMESKIYTIDDQDEFIADFIEALSINLQSNADIEVDILQADHEKGLLSVKVTEHFKHINGNDGTVDCTKTIIFNKTPEQTTPIYTVTCYLHDQVYKVYCISENEPIILPTVADKWQDSDGNLIGSDFVVTQDINLFAVQ